MKINLSHNIQHSQKNTTEEKQNWTTLTLSLYKDSNRFIFKSENDFFPSYNHVLMKLLAIILVEIMNTCICQLMDKNILYSREVTIKLTINSSVFYSLQSKVQAF